MRVMYHRLGTAQADDLLIVDPAIAQHDPKWLTNAKVTHDGRFVLFTVYKGTEPANKLYYVDMDALVGRKQTLTGAGSGAAPEGSSGKDASIRGTSGQGASTGGTSGQLASIEGTSGPGGSNGEPEWNPINEGSFPRTGVPFLRLIDNFDAEYGYVHNSGEEFTFITNLHAPRYKLIRIHLSRPAQSEWTTLVAEHARDVLEWATVVDTDKLVLCYLSDVKVHTSLLCSTFLHSCPFFSFFPEKGQKTGIKYI